MSRRALLSVLFAGLASLSALAQSYQTSFSNVKFDRAKGPATFNAGVEVDAATGAASISLPFGPGIGERGLKFRPLLSMRMGPQLAVSSSDENVVVGQLGGTAIWGTQTVDTLYQRGFGSATFSPGTLDLGSMVSHFDRKVTSYALPGGGGGRVLGQLPASITPAVVQSLLSKFGFGAADTVGYGPGDTTRSVKAPLIQMGSDGSLVVGLRIAGPSTGITDEVSDDIQQYPPSNLVFWDFPRRMVVIKGDVAYEFHYVHHTYMTRTIPYLAINQKTQLYSGHYVITKIRNKFGEYIDFSYDADGIGYTATWSTNPLVKIRVQVVGTVNVPAGQPRLLDNRFQVSSATQIRVSYLGISQPVSSYLLEVSDPNLGGALALSVGGGPASTGANSPNGIIDWDWVDFDTAVQSVQPIRVAQEAAAEEIRFSYGTGPASSWDNGIKTTVAPTVLTSVSFPTRTVSLSWEPYWYRMNYSPEGWGGFVPSTLPGRPAIGYGVVRTDDFDGVQLRQTAHSRVVPTSNWNNLPLGQIPPDQWVDTTFYDAITHPDGSVSVHRFVSPPATNGIASVDGMQNLAFIKTLEQEVRYYAPGVDWKSDLSATSPASSSAYKWVAKDRFDVRTAGSPNGDLGSQSVPYPTRVRTWDKESQVLTVEETADWDSTAFGWKASHTTTSITATPSLAVDYLGLAQQGLGYSAYPASQGVYRRVDKTFEPKSSDWIFARVKTERTTTVEDNTGFMAPGVTLPDAQPLLNRTFNTDINRVDSIDVSNTGAPTVTTAFTFQGTSGLAGIELLSAYLNAPGLGLSGQMGVSAYGYDANGYLNSISQKPNAGMALTVSQSSDELGRPVTQTDMNGTVKTFSWDLAGRLSGITSSDGDAGISISYNDSDHRGITVTRGAQVSVYRYNGFGQLIVERRMAPDSSWSHRLYGYDTAGRKTGETIWLAGDGANQETEWIKAYLTRSITSTTTTQDITTCKTWGLDAGGNAVCLVWQTIPGTTTTTTNPAAYTGVAMVYDGRGRVILTQDANGVQTTNDYFGPSTLPTGVGSYVGPIRRVILGVGTAQGQVTWYETDAASRLVRVTNALTQYTEYRYDGGGRIGEVRQYDSAGHVQVRSWGYSRLGWLENLSQPESGTTTYANFTVAGKPTVTSYNGRIVRMTPDWMGRPLSISADDGTVSQTFAYDTALNGLGRLASSTDGSVTTAFSYGGQGKRLDSLVTTVQVQGTSQVFPQAFSYDIYGNRTSGNTGHGVWAQSYHAAAGLPSQLSYGATPVASTPWAAYDPVSWALKSISYGNGAASTFDYGADQARLSAVKHLDSQMAIQADWAYSYDGVGNLTWEYDKTKPDGNGSFAFDHYAFDGLNRLISANIQSSTYGEQLQQFDYDAFGNRISSSLQRVTGWSGAKGISTAYVTASSVPTGISTNLSASDLALLQKNQLPATTSAGALTGATYDAQGNLTQVFQKPGDTSTSVTMTYDALGRVTSLGRSGAVFEQYHYSAEGLRTLIEEWQGSTLLNRRYNVYNDARQLVSQYEEALSGGTVSPGAMQLLATTSKKTKTSKSKTSIRTVAAAVGVNPIITSPSGPITVRVNETVMFSGSSPDGNGGSWAFGDGASASGWNTSHAYSAPGTYTVTLTTQVPTQGRCLSWGWDDAGNRVCNQYETNWVAQSTTVAITVLPNAPSILSFTASPTTIPIGSSSTLNWNVSGADSVTLSGSAVPASGGQVVYPSTTTSFALTASNAGGTSSATVTVNVVQAPVISWFSASPTTIYQGDGSTLSWAVSSATALSLDQGLGSVIGTSTIGVSPSGTTAYTLTAVNSLNGVSVTRTASAIVTVNPRPTVPTIVSFTADAPSVGAGNGTYLRWNVTNAVGSVNVSVSSFGSVSAISSAWIVPGATTTYTLTATNSLDSSKSVSANVTVTVVQKPAITFGASTTSVNVGNSTTLTWSCTNGPTSVSIDNGVGAVGASGSTVVTPSITTTYTINASNLGGPASAQVTIYVTQLPVITGFVASPPGITKGRSSTLSWSTQGATSITLNGQAMTNTSAVVAPSTTQTYTLVVTNSAGFATAQVTVTVTDSGTLTWKRDILYLGSREAAEIDTAGMHVTQVDYLGSPRIVTGPTGQVESQQKYLPYGELLEQSGTFKSAKGYTNHEQTDASGLIYMQARFYIPWFGRFASPDPARDQHFEDTQSWNIYSYVRNNPIMSTDPTGMETEEEKKANGLRPGPNDRPYIAASEVLPQPKAQPKIDSLVSSVPVEVKRAIQKSLDASNSPTEDDKTGRFHEEGGQWGKGVDGNVLVYPAVPGKVSKPGDKEANVDSGEAVDQQGKINNLATTDGKWHIHPMGDGLNGKRGFLQGPSPGDLKRPSDEFAPTNIVVGAASRRVYFYDAKGEIAEVALSDFMKGVK